MKLSRAQLKKIIKEEMAHLSPGRDLDPSSTGEGKMTRAQLHHIAEYASELYNMIYDGDNLPEWVQSKISVAASDIGKVKHYLEYKIKHSNPPAVSPVQQQLAVYESMNRRVLLEAPTGNDIMQELSSIRQRLEDLTNILEIGNTETPEMGGIDTEAQTVMASYTEDAMNVIDSIITELEEIIKNGGVY